MLTKLQKRAQVDFGGKKINESKSILFADFSKVPTSEINKLKTSLREQGATFKVMKKRLMRIALQDAGIAFDPTQTKNLLGVIFSQEGMSEIAGPVYKFGKELEKQEINFKVFGAYDGAEKKLLSDEEFVMIAKLPSREVLLAMVMGGFSGPVRAFMSIVKQLSEKQPEAAAAPTEATPEAASPSQPTTEAAQPTAQPAEQEQAKTVEENK